MTTRRKVLSALAFGPWVLLANYSRAGRGYTKPPPGSRLDAGHPLAPDLLCCVLNDGGARARDLAKFQRHGTLLSADFRVGQRGLVITHDSTGDRVSFGDSSWLPLNTVTVVIGLRKRDATNRVSGAFGVDSSTAAHRLGAHVPFSDGIVYWDFGGLTEGTTRLSVSGLTVTGNNIWAFTSGPYGMEIWQNGILRASNSANPTRTSTTQNLQLNNHGQQGGDLVDEDFFYLYSRQLRRDEIRWLANEPYAPIAVPTYRRWSVPAAAVPFSPGIINNPIIMP